MKMRIGMTCLLAVLGATSLWAEDVAGLPLHVQKLNDRAVRVWLGDYISSTAVVAFATKRGIVVVDTMGIPSVDGEIRKVIARELGRGDFKYLVNTHEHGDHTMGNSVYSDCAIVAHDLCASGMQAAAESREQTAKWYAERVGQVKSELEKKPAGSPEAKKLHEELVLALLGADAFKSDNRPTPPTITFSDRMRVDLGDTAFELYFTGGVHTASDISVFVPEQGVLLTGDTMADVWLTDSPGCLAAFMVRPDVRHDFPLLLENWGILEAKKDKIKDIVPGHWNGDVTVKGFEDRYRYIKTLWEGVNSAVKEGKSVDWVMAEYALKKRFPELVDSPGITVQNNFSTLAGIWSEVTKESSAASKLYELIDGGRPEEEVRAVVDERGRTPSKYYFLEAEINAYGYRFAQEKKSTQALAMFKANAALYPASWNVYDSLAEAYLATGDNVSAVKYYEKSVEINPANRNGRDALERIRSSGK